jgi:enamine deaminase RidA (YjgF/YER057c/UK114 family)
MTSKPTRQIIDNLKMMLESADSDLDHVVHVNVFLKDMAGQPSILERQSLSTA